MLEEIRQREAARREEFRQAMLEEIRQRKAARREEQRQRQLSIMETRALTNGLLASYTGNTIEEIDAATSYDHFFNAQEAVDFGLCDRIGTIFDTDFDEKIAF